MIRAFLQVHCRFQAYTTQDTTALVRVFLQVKGVSRHTAGLIKVSLQVNCNFEVHTKNADNRSSGNEGTRYDPARLIVCEIFL